MRFIAIALSAAMAFGPGGGVEKVTICHKGHTITIGAPAVDAHLRNHGDTIGACSDGSDPAPSVEEGQSEPSNPRQPTTTTTEPPAAVCQEDEPCWDCETMGNWICGPITTPPSDDSHPIESIGGNFDDLQVVDADTGQETSSTIFLWLGFIVALMIFITSVYGSIVLFTRQRSSGE